MKIIPTFEANDNGSIIQTYKKIIKNSSMKAIHLLIATLIMMSLASCTAESSDPVDN